MKNVYLALTLVGAVAPYVFFVQHFDAAGFAIGDFLGAAFANGVAGGLTADVLVASAAFWVYLSSRKDRLTWLYVLLNVAVGLSCALPLYLYLNARNSALAPQRPVAA